MDLEKLQNSFSLNPKILTFSNVGFLVGQKETIGNCGFISFIVVIEVVVSYNKNPVMLDTTKLMFKHIEIIKKQQVWRSF